MRLDAGEFGCRMQAVSNKNASENPGAIHCVPLEYHTVRNGLGALQQSK